MLIVAEKISLLAHLKVEHVRHLVIHVDIHSIETVQHRGFSRDVKINVSRVSLERTVDHSLKLTNIAFILDGSADQTTFSDVSGGALSSRKTA